MARQRPLSELSPAYRHRIEAAEARGFTRTQARGHPEESPGTLGIRAFDRASEEIRSSSDARAVVEGDRAYVSWTNDQGRITEVVMSRRQWTQIRPKGRPRAGARKPKVWEYRKRKRRA